MASAWRLLAPLTKEHRLRLEQVGDDELKVKACAMSYAGGQLDARIFFSTTTYKHGVAARNIVDVVGVPGNWQPIARDARALDEFAANADFKRHHGLQHGGHRHGSAKPSCTTADVEHARASSERKHEQRAVRALPAARRAARLAQEAAMPPSLLSIVRDVYQHFGWLSSDKLVSVLHAIRHEPRTSKQLPPTHWHNELPGDLRGYENGSRREEVLRVAWSMVKRERKAAGLPTLSSPPKRQRS